MTCTYESGSNPFTVPEGVSSIHVVAVGGAGDGEPTSGGRAGDGGAGTPVEGDLAVASGATLHAIVGRNGTEATAENGRSMPRR